MRSIQVAIACFSLGLLAACQPADPIDRVTGPTVAETAAIARDPAALERYVRGNTLWSSNEPPGGHGTQIEYHSPQGNVFLWYPGNARIVRGKWKIEAAGDRPLLCYQYQRNSYNPVTGQMGGNWECSTQNWVHLPVAMAGDPFSLAMDKVPFVIPDKGYYSPARLMVMAGKDPALIRMVRPAGQP